MMKTRQCDNHPPALEVLDFCCCAAARTYLAEALDPNSCATCSVCAYASRGLGVLSNSLSCNSTRR